MSAKRYTFTRVEFWAHKHLWHALLASVSLGCLLAGTQRRTSEAPWVLIANQVPQTENLILVPKHRKKITFTHKIVGLNNELWRLGIASIWTCTHQVSTGLVQRWISNYQHIFCGVPSVETVTSFHLGMCQNDENRSGYQTKSVLMSFAMDNCFLYSEQLITCRWENTYKMLVRIRYILFFWFTDHCLHYDL